LEGKGGNRKIADFKKFSGERIEKYVFVLDLKRKLKFERWGGEYFFGEDEVRVGKEIEMGEVYLKENEFKRELPTLQNLLEGVKKDSFRVVSVWVLYRQLFPLFFGKLYRER